MSEELGPLRLKIHYERTKHKKNLSEKAMQLNIITGYNIQTTYTQKVRTLSNFTLLKSNLQALQTQL